MSDRDPHFGVTMEESAPSASLGSEGRAMSESRRALAAIRRIVLRTHGLKPGTTAEDALAIALLDSERKSEAEPDSDDDAKELLELADLALMDFDKRMAAVHHQLDAVLARLGA